MISISCDHPDLEKFITVKNDLDRVNYANISVRVTDTFLQAVVDNADWELRFTREETGEVISKTIKAKELYRKLCESNWNYAEPGILFWDRIRRYNLQSENPEFEYAGTNPCAEEPLPAGGACNLGSLNLAAFVTEDDDGNPYFDYEEFACCVHLAVQILDAVQREGEDKHPLPMQRKAAKDWRQIGLGIMGLADMLIKLGVAYGSPESLSICDKIGHNLAEDALFASSDCAEIYGPYPNWSEKVFRSNYYRNHAGEGSWLDRKIHENKLANSQLLTIAPTGTLSTMLGISGGIEPIFANYYTRTTKTLHDGRDVTYKVYTPIVRAYMEAHGITDDADLPAYFVTSADIPIENRIAMQAVWQSHIDASISSTINLPHEATVEDVERLYIGAWQAGLKGVTVYRAGCAREGILNAAPDKPDNTGTESEASRNIPMSENVGLERHLTTGCGSLHVCAFFDGHGDLKNTYLSKGSTGGCNNFMIGLSRMISLAARNGVKLDQIIDQLHSCGSCPSYAVRRATKRDTSEGSCCPVAIGNALLDMWREANGADKQPTKPEPQSPEPERESSDRPTTADRCPECGGTLVHEMGCVTCTSCGYSKCG